MNRAYFSVLTLILVILIGCSKSPKTYKNNKETTGETYRIKLREYIEKASQNPDHKRLERFAKVLSEANSEYIKSNLEEKIIKIRDTDYKAIVYRLKKVGKNQTLGRGYYGYVLFLDGWFRYCYILEADDGSWVLVDNTSAGFPPKWSGIEMEDLAFSFDMMIYQFC